MLARNPAAGTTALTHALAAMREPWEPETTARNLRLIREARALRGEVLDWADQAEAGLLRTAGV